jgi:hypothetical protein
VGLDASVETGEELDVVPSGASLLGGTRGAKVAALGLASSPGLSERREFGDLCLRQPQSRTRTGS